MSEFNPMEKMGSEHLTSRPLSSSSAATAGRGHRYAAEAPRVLARMPDMGTAEAAHEAQLPSLEHDGRLLSSRVSVAILMGGVAMLLLVALGSYVFFGTNKADEDMATWQPDAPAPNAAEAPAWGGAMQNHPSPYAGVGGAQAYPSSVTPSAAPANGGWNNTAPSTGWNPEVANRPTMPWRGEDQPSTQNTWGATGDFAPRAEQPQPNAWSSTTPIPATPSTSYDWNSTTPTTSSPTASQDATASWNTPNQTPAWSNPASPYGVSAQPYGTTSPTPSTSWNTATQTSAVEGQPSTASTEASRPVGPMMPNAPTSFNASYESSRTQPSYGNSYQPQTDTPRTAMNGQAPATGYTRFSQNDSNAYRQTTTNPQPAATQPYNYGTGSYESGSQPSGQPSYQATAPNSYRGADVQPAPAMSNNYSANAGYALPSSYNQPANYSNTQPSYQPSYQPAQSNAYPAAGSASYPTSGVTAPASYRGETSYPNPGAAQFQGTIEKPSVRTTYDRTGSSLY